MSTKLPDAANYSERTGQIAVENYPEFLTAALKHNDPLGPLEQAIVRAYQAEAQQNAKKREEDAKSANPVAAAWKQLFKIEPHLSKWHRACNTVLAPVRHIPPEIIQEIAILSLPPRPSATLRHSPMSLSHVCSSWRIAVTSLPQLWSVLYFEIEYRTDLERCASLVQGWFTRAKNAPLSLSVYFQSDCVDGFDDNHLVVDYYAELFISISTWLSRIRHLNLGSLWTDKILDLLTQSRLSELESLTLLSKPEAGSLSMNCLLGPLLCTMPSLKTLVVDTSIVDKRTSSWANRLSVSPQLVHLTLRDSLSISEMIDVLQVCPNLEVAELELDDDMYELPPMSPSRTSLALRKLSLDIRTHDDINATDLLRRFTFPHLQTLKIHHLVFTRRPRITSLKKGAHVPNGLPSLRKVCLFGAWPHLLGAYTNLLVEAPAVVHARMDLTWFNTTQLKLLTGFLMARHPSRTLINLPGLAIMELAFCHESDFKKSRVLAVARFRNEDGHPLKQVRVYVSNSGANHQGISGELTVVEDERLSRLCGDTTSRKAKAPTFVGNPVSRKFVDPWYSGLQEARARRLAQEQKESEGDS